jgi:hypothetical protein
MMRAVRQETINTLFNHIKVNNFSSFAKLRKTEQN